MEPADLDSLSTLEDVTTEPRPRLFPDDVLPGLCELDVHWRDALVAEQELRAAAAEWRAGGPTGNVDVGRRVAEQLDRVADELEREGRVGARLERRARQRGAG